MLITIVIYFWQTRMAQEQKSLWLTKKHDRVAGVQFV